MFKDNIHCTYFAEPRLNILLDQAEMELNKHQLIYTIIHQQAANIICIQVLGTLITAAEYEIGFSDKETRNNLRHNQQIFSIQESKIEMQYCNRNVRDKNNEKIIINKESALAKVTSEKNQQEVLKDYAAENLLQMSITCFGQ